MTWSHAVPPPDRPGTAHPSICGDAAHAHGSSANARSGATWVSLPVSRDGDGDQLDAFSLVKAVSGCRGKRDQLSPLLHSAPCPATPEPEADPGAGHGIGYLSTGAA